MKPRAPSQVGRSRGGPRGRVRRAAKWSTCALCALIGVLWAGSFVRSLWCCRHEIPSDDSRFPRTQFVYVDSGQLALGFSRGSVRAYEGTPPPDTGWELRRSGRFPRESSWLPTYRVGLPYYWYLVNVLTIPLWIPFIASASLAVWLWRRDGCARRAEGRCRACGYDLAGLVSGAVCPECGKSEKVIA